MRTPLLAVALFGLFASVSPSADSLRPEDPAAPEVVEVSMGEVFRDPLPYLGKTVRFTVQTHEVRGTWNAWMTRFGPDDFTALSVWADEQFLWRTEEWAAPVGLLFTRRGVAAAAALQNAERYERIEVEAHVDQVFLGRPWLEVRSAIRLKERVDEGCLLHASRALRLMEGEAFARAASDLERALASDLPAHARVELERLATGCETPDN